MDGVVVVRIELSHSHEGVVRAYGKEDGCW